LALAPCLPILSLYYFAVFSLHAPAPTHLYTLSLHDALPISRRGVFGESPSDACRHAARIRPPGFGDPPRSISPESRSPIGWRSGDRKSTRLNSSHGSISYAVFCLKKKKKH